MNASEIRRAIVLAGGGARGAYEAGVLSYIYEEVPRRTGSPVHFDILTGTSVGAIHACYLAGAQQGALCAGGLLDIWRSLTFESVMALSVGAVLGVPWRMFGFGLQSAPGGDRIPGLFDTSGLESLVERAVDWGRIRDNVDNRRVIGLAVTATEIATGKSIVFADRPDGASPSCAGDPFVETVPARIGLSHALASAAIPMIFPAIRIGNRYYSDGGLRMNTPLAPALRMGADRVLVIGLRPPADEIEPQLDVAREAAAQSPIYLAGKALNTLMVDRVEYDLARMELFNDILREGVASFGEGFLETVNRPIVARRGRAYKIIDSLFIRPSRDLAVEAGECIEGQARSSLASPLKRWVLGHLVDAEVSEADILSYLYFDACYAERLIEMGRSDAAALEDELVEFFS